MAKVKPERRLRLDVKMSVAHFIYPLITSTVFSSTQKYEAACWQPQKCLYIHKAYEHQSHRTEQVKGLRTTPCTAGAGISQTIRRQKKPDSSFGLWGFLLRPPLLLTKFSQCPQQLLWGGWGWTIVSFFLPLTLCILLEQGYHRHSNKSSNNCTKTTVSNKNKKQKPATKPLGALHCLCRWPYTFK